MKRVMVEKVDNKPLKIAMIGHKRIPSREGGVEIVVEELSKRLVQLGYQVTCFNRRGSHVSGGQYNENSLTEYQGIIIKTVCTFNQKGLAAMSSSFFAAIQTAFGPYDIVHFHAEGPCAMMWLPKLFGKKCIATIHGLDHQRAKWGRLASKYIMLGEKTAVKHADEIIVLSRGVQDYFNKNYNRQTKFIPNGVTRPEIRQADLIRSHYELERDSYILFLGRIVPEKGLRYLVDAYKSVTTDKKLLIAGSSSDTKAFFEEMQQIASNDPRILFTGFVQGQILEELYSNAYIYILPSDLEGMPLSLLEAMSYGNCCLVSDIPECADVVEDKGIVFIRSNISDLTEKLQWSFDNPDEVKRYKSNAADFICNKYNWDDVVDRTLNLYA
jgi:glycosyltransferase involved in cell wall biosynthesis